MPSRDLSSLQKLLAISSSVCKGGPPAVTQGVEAQTLRISFRFSGLTLPAFPRKTFISEFCILSHVSKIGYLQTLN